MIRQNKEFDKIVKLHNQMINSLISQKARGDQSFNEQTEEMKNILAIPSNRFLDWAKSLDVFIKTTINSKINDMELIGKYKEYVKELVAYQAQNDDINQQLREVNQDYDLLTNIIIRLENKLVQTKISSSAVDDKIRNLQNRLNDAQEIISSQEDKIEALEAELIEARKNKYEPNQETEYDDGLDEEEDVRAPISSESNSFDDVDDATDQAWDSILNDDADEKKRDDERLRDVKEDEDYDDDYEEDDSSDESSDDSSDELEDEVEAPSKRESSPAAPENKTDLEEENENNSSNTNDENADAKPNTIPKVHTSSSFKIYGRPKVKKKYGFTRTLIMNIIESNKDAAYTIEHIYEQITNLDAFKERPIDPPALTHHIKDLVKTEQIYQFSDKPACRFGLNTVYSKSLNPKNLPKTYVLSNLSKEIMKKNKGKTKAPKKAQK